MVWVCNYAALGFLVSTEAVAQVAIGKCVRLVTLCALPLLLWLQPALLFCVVCSTSIVLVHFGATPVASAVHRTVTLGFHVMSLAFLHVAYVRHVWFSSCVTVLQVSLWGASVEVEMEHPLVSRYIIHKSVYLCTFLDISPDRKVHSTKVQTVHSSDYYIAISTE